MFLNNSVLMMGDREARAIRRPSCFRRRSLDDAHDVALLHDQEILAVDLDLGARPLAEQDAVAGLDVERDQLALLVAAAGADGDDLAFLRLFLGGVGNDDDAAIHSGSNGNMQEAPSRASAEVSTMTTRTTHTIVRFSAPFHAARLRRRAACR
jgi:hypothetical protein